MRLISLWLENFRQFYDKQEVHFADGEHGRNVTVIHGHNGSGKTAFLNAFVWCLYGETTPDLEEPDRLENERALAEAASGNSVRVGVRLAYEEQGVTFIVERSRTVVKESATSVRRSVPRLDMWRIEGNGKSQVEGREADDRQLRVNQLLPKALYPFFFFNGERVERLARPDAYNEVEAGVKTLLDVEIFERTVRHLGAASGELRREWKDIGDDETRGLVEEQEQIEKEKVQIESDMLEAKAKSKAISDEIGVFEAKQASLAALTELTKKRSALRDELKRVEDNLDNVNADLTRIVSADGYLAFAEPVFIITAKLVQEARQRGDIPAKIKPQFVDDLLQQKQCICGRPLVGDTAEVKALVAWKASAGLAALEESISKTAAMIGPFRQRRDAYFQAMDRLQSRRSELLGDRSRLKEDLAIVDQQLGDKDLGEDAAGLAGRLETLRNDLQTQHIKLLVLQRDHGEKEDKLEELRERLKKVEARDAKAALLKRQSETVDRVAASVDRIYQIKKESVRERLDKQIREIVTDAMLKDYRASVTDEYRLMLTKKVGEIEQPVFGPSTGERQVLALAFVGSLVKAAAENLEPSAAEGMVGLALGGRYPLIMDSPFGMLEDLYRQKVAEWVPKLAQQVVVLVSNTQWREEAERAMAPRIGREYILELHTAKQHADMRIALRGQTLVYVVSSTDPFEYTAIREVS